MLLEPIISNARNKIMFIENVLRTTGPYGEIVFVETLLKRFEQ